MSRSRLMPDPRARWTIYEGGSLMARPKQPRTFVAIESFASQHGDAVAGSTLVNEQSEMYKAYPEWFREVAPAQERPEVEAATRAPGETRSDPAED